MGTPQQRRRSFSAARAQVRSKPEARRSSRPAPEGLPVAYLTAYLSLRAAGFQPGKAVFSPAIGGSVGNAVTQLARAMGGKHAISSTTSRAKAAYAKSLGFDEVIDLSSEKLADGVRRITDGYGVDLVIDPSEGKFSARP